MQLWLDLLYVLISIGLLWKAAGWFVEGAVGIAERLGIPQMVVGLVLVSIATSTPEIMASLLAALQGMPEVALGNAVGSVIIDESVALGLAAVIASYPLIAEPSIFRSSAPLLVLCVALGFLLSFDGVLSRWEGAGLVSIYVVNTVITYIQTKGQRRASLQANVVEDLVGGELHEIEEAIKHMKMSKILLLFGAGLVGVLIGAQLLLWGGVGIAEAFGLPPVVIGLTVVALGTSTPEIATSVVAALRRQSGIAVGNILGSDIINICLVAGLSATVNPLVAERKVIFIMFPAALIIVITMLALLRRGYQLGRLDGAILLTLYVLQLAVLLYFVPVGQGT